MCVLCDSCKSYYDINNNSEKKKFCKKCYNKQYRIDNREYIRELNKQWRIDNRQKIKQYKIDNRQKIKQYNIDNRQKRKEQKKQYDIDNREKKKEQKKQWDIDNHDINTIKNWKRYGLIELQGVYTYESLYEYYISITHCEVCNKKFKNSFDKCLDHCHTTNIFRWVLCRNCNTMDKWMDLI